MSGFARTPPSANWKGPAHMSDHHRQHLEEQIALHRHLSSVYTEKRYAPAYSVLYQKHWNEVLCQIGGIPAGAKVIDLGCGTGILVPELVAKHYQVIGLDLSFDMLKVSGQNSDELSRVCGDGCALPFTSSSIDAIFCRGSIHHFSDLQLAFQEIIRVLKPGGYLIFSEPSNDSVLNRLARRLMYRHSEEFHEDDEGFRRAEILEMLAALGLIVDHSRGFGFLAYALAGFPDKLDVLGKIPGNCVITRLLIGVDTFLAALPGINRLGLHWMVRARKV
jgi:ubiquinone/menaquinone biosynthesis C-methylase UbiE